MNLKVNLRTQQKAIFVLARLLSSVLDHRKFDPINSVLISIVSNAFTLPCVREGKGVKGLFYR